METINERSLARGRRLDPDRDMPAAAADFYLLENLAMIRADRWAVERLATHESTLAVEFTEYLDMAIGGELRYAKRYCEELPRELEPFFKEVSQNGRGKAWLVWTIIRRKYGLRALELAEETFFAPGWRRNFGGDAWGLVARGLRAHLEGKHTPRVFVDHVFNLEHNTGSVLNKLYNVSTLPRVLEAHGCDDYTTLLTACSPEVRTRWRYHDWMARRDHDPAWLGVQMLDSFDEVA